MQKRNLGNTGISIAPLVFGGNVFGWTIDEQQSFKMLDAFTDAGFNCIDTADVYSRWVDGNAGGESETIIGNWLNKTGKRDKVIIATKGGMDLGSGKKGLSKNYIIEAVEASLKRLQTDYIDLYQAHKPDDFTPIEETLEAFDSLIKQGKVRAIGCSNYSGEQLNEALKVSSLKKLNSFQTLQPNYNLYERELFEKELQTICVDNNIGVISFYGLANGFLTGKYRSQDDLGKTERGKRVEKYMNERGMRILDALDKVSQKINAPLAAISLAWIMAQPGITAPISSATSIEQLNELVRSTEIYLDADDLELLNNAGKW